MEHLEQKMGSAFSKLFDKLFGKKDMRILMVGYGLVRIRHPCLLHAHLPPPAHPLRQRA